MTREVDDVGLTSERVELSQTRHGAVTVRSNDALGDDTTRKGELM